MNDFKFTGTVEIFPGLGGWHYIIVPSEISKITKTIAKRGFTPIKANVGNTVFKTSLMPFGDGRQFIALSKKVRNKEAIKIGDKLTISFNLRDY